LPVVFQPLFISGLYTQNGPRTDKALRAEILGEQSLGLNGPELRK
jgi:hypothetical protein